MIRKFMSLFKRKETNKVEINVNGIVADISKLLDSKSTYVRVGYDNSHGDEEACDWTDYKVAKRSTGKKKDIIRVYIYENLDDDDFKYVLRARDCVVVFNEKAFKISKEETKHIISMLPEPRHYWEN